MYPSGKTLVLTLTSLCVLGLATIRPAAAQNLVYTLSGVTFSDGAVATGFFDFNPATDTFGSYDITTTNGVTDSLVGAHYTAASVLTSSPPFMSFGIDYVFSEGSSTANFHSLLLQTNAQITSPGTYSLNSGVVSPPTFFGSGELTPDPRAIATGFLTVTPAAVPEASTTVSFGLLLALGMGGVVIAAKKKAHA